MFHYQIRGCQFLHGVGRVLSDNDADSSVVIQITGDYWRALDININGDYWICNYWRLLEITGDYWRVLDINGNYWRLLELVEIR